MSMPRHEAMQCGYLIPGWLWPAEQGWLYDNMAHSRSHLEIGSYAGKSLFVTCAGFNQPAKAIAVDSVEGTILGPVYQRRLFDAAEAFIEANTTAEVEFLPMRSVEAFTELSKRNITFDTMFIDGCHQYAECKADIEMWSTLLRPDGLLAGHDYWPKDVGVMDAVNETGPFQVAADTRIWYRYNS